MKQAATLGCSCSSTQFYKRKLEDAFLSWHAMSPLVMTVFLIDWKYLSLHFDPLSLP